MVSEACAQTGILAEKVASELLLLSIDAGWL
jgi:hypothetical protein